MRDLAVGVDSGIGAAGAVDDDAAAAQAREGLLDVILHGVASGLALPAAEGGAVVGDEEFEAHGSAQHGLGVEPALQDHLRGDLVDDGAALFDVAAVFVEDALGGDGGEAFVPEFDGAVGQRALSCSAKARAFSAAGP